MNVIKTNIRPTDADKASVQCVSVLLRERVMFTLQTYEDRHRLITWSLSLSLSAAVYLCKRTMQNKARLELADYEAVSVSLICWYGLMKIPLNIFSVLTRLTVNKQDLWNNAPNAWQILFLLSVCVCVCVPQESLARLQRAFARKWEFIFMQAEAQAK